MDWNDFFSVMTPPLFVMAIAGAITWKTLRDNARYDAAKKAIMAPMTGVGSPK